MWIHLKGDERISGTGDFLEEVLDHVPIGWIADTVSGKTGMSVEDRNPQNQPRPPLTSREEQHE